MRPRPTARAVPPPSDTLTTPPAAAAMLRSDWLIVAGLCTVALAVELHLSRVWFFGFDENWHVFIASVEPFAQFIRELKWESHPPLSYVPMRWLTPLHGSPVWPRLVSILPSLVTVVLAYRCAAVMRFARPVAILTALLFAVSSAHLNMALAVRAYSLATMLTMAAYFFLLRILNDPARARRTDRLGFVLTALLAVWSEYSALFAVGAMLATLTLESLRRPELRGALRLGIGRRAARDLRAEARRLPWAEPLLLLGGLLGLFRWMHWSHGTGLVGHLPVEYFRAPGESLFEFALRGAVLTLDQFAPLGFSSDRLPAVAPVLLLAALGWLATRSLTARSTDAMWVRSSAVLILVLVWGAIFVLAARGAYPYGGRMRHQFVLFPFLAFVMLSVVDEAYRRSRSTGARALVCLTVAASILATSAAAVRQGQLEEFSPASSLWPAEIQRMMAGRRDEDVVYASRLNVIALFSHLRDRRWTGVEHGGGRDLFMVESQNARPIRVLRETSEWWLPSPLDQQAATRLADAMRRHGIAHAWVLALVLDARPITATRRDDGPVRALLAPLGLALDRRLVFESGEALRVTIGVSPESG